MAHTSLPFIISQRAVSGRISSHPVKTFRFMFLGFSDHPVSLPLFGARANLLSLTLGRSILFLLTLVGFQQNVDNEYCRLIVG